LRDHASRGRNEANDIIMFFVLFVLNSSSVFSTPHNDALIKQKKKLLFYWIGRRGQ
jgi:hypothetical protein